jgi:hypothetical protein
MKQGVQDSSIPMGEKKYFAFLSYAHKDAQAAAALGRYIEAFRVPVRLAGEGRLLPKRMSPVFGNRAEFPESSRLGTAVRDAIASSGALVVLCSPAAKQSKWIDEEIRAFRQGANPKRIFPVLLEGEPSDAFPSALTEGNAEPLAVDFRPYRDNTRDAHLRLVAALLGIDFDMLKRREAARKRNAWVRAAALVVIVVAAAAGAFLAYE